MFLYSGAQVRLRALHALMQLLHLCTNAAHLLLHAHNSSAQLLPILLIYVQLLRHLLLQLCAAISQLHDDPPILPNHVKKFYKTPTQLLHSFFNILYLPYMHILIPRNKFSDFISHLF